MPDQVSTGGSPRHNHLTRDIKPEGSGCPACDDYHKGRNVADPLNGGESHFTQQSIDSAVDFAQRFVLVNWMRDLGLEAEAGNLGEAADDAVSQVAYDIADTVVDMCGSEELPELAVQLRRWADAHDDLDPRNTGFTRKPPDGTPLPGPGRGPHLELQLQGRDVEGQCPGEATPGAIG